MIEPEGEESIIGKPLKILYVAPENPANTLALFAEEHRRRGNLVRFVTLFPSTSDFEEDICLNLPLVPAKTWFRQAKEKIYRPEELYREATGIPPQWGPSRWERLFFRLRDLLWIPRIKKALREYNLLDYDIYHLESGHGFLRLSPWPFDSLKAAGKHIVVHYHGNDLRTRGVLPWIDDLAELHLTSELDLLQKHPRLRYLFLPFRVRDFKPRYTLNQPLRICHATRDRYWKGSDVIIAAARKLERTHGVKFVLIENQPYQHTLELKAQCDIYIDQVSNLGGWGYGMNSVEALSLGLACCTNMVPEYEHFLPDHPFYNVRAETLYEDLVRLVENPDLVKELKQKGRAWVEKTHDVQAVVDMLYSYYRELGWLN